MWLARAIKHGEHGNGLGDEGGGRSVDLLLGTGAGARIGGVRAGSTPGTINSPLRIGAKVHCEHPSAFVNQHDEPRNDTQSHRPEFSD